MATRKKSARKKKSSSKKKVSTKKVGRKKTSSRKKSSTSSATSKNLGPLQIKGHPDVPVSTPTEIQNAFKKLQNGRQRMKETTAKERIQRLKKLRDAIENQQDALFEAVYLDFRKSRTEMELTELVVIKAEINDAINQLSTWMAPEQVETPLTLMGSSSWVCYEPLGTVLILSPWNYPFLLAINPLVTALAAGNTVLLKPSEFVPHTSRFIKQLISDVFPSDEVIVLEGDHTTAQALTALPFDHIFFTGSTPVGKSVMRAAADNLCQVTLELGGKSPVIVDRSADIRLAARRVIWGKGVNAGQTCIGPDYAFVPTELIDEFVAECRLAIEDYYGLEPKNSPDYCRIISHRHCQRLIDLYKQALQSGAETAVGGDFDVQDRFIEPTVLTKVKADNPIMQEEIFGPILPVIEYQNLEDVYDHISENDKPLALYIFAKKNKTINEILSRTTAGGTSINDIMTHIANTHLPFGGVNQSGIGSYHGYYGFKALSHERAILRQGRFNLLGIFAPPYTPRVQRLTRLVRRWLV